MNINILMKNNNLFLIRKKKTIPLCLTKKVNHFHNVITLQIKRSKLKVFVNICFLCWAMGVNGI